MKGLLCSYKMNVSSMMALMTDPFV